MKDSGPQKMYEEEAKVQPSSVMNNQNQDRSEQRRKEEEILN